MKNIFIILGLLFFFSLLQATFLSINIVLLIVLSLAVLRPAKSGLIWAFLAGVILDVITGGTLGLSSLAFLVIIFLLNLYKAKFKADNLLYLMPFTFLSVALYSFVQTESFQFVNNLITTVLLILILPSLNSMVGKNDENSLQLPLKI